MTARQFTIKDKCGGPVVDRELVADLLDELGWAAGPEGWVQFVADGVYEIEAPGLLAVPWSYTSDDGLTITALDKRWCGPPSGCYLLESDDVIEGGRP